MNQDPTNPINPATAATPPVSPMPTPNVPSPDSASPALETPAMPTPPSMEAPVAPETPVAPEVPTIDPSIIQQAINDVPEEATTSAPAAPTATPLENLGSEIPTPPAAPQDPNLASSSPFASATPVADFNVSSPAQNATPAPNAGNPAQNPPSVAFNDPAAEEEKKEKPGTIHFKKPAFLDKMSPVAMILIGGTIVIVALILIIYFLTR